MKTPYEVTYRGMWPSELLNHQVRSCLEQLRAAQPDVGHGQAIFENSEHGLVVRVRAEIGGRWCVSKREVESAKDPFKVLNEIQAGFDQVGRELAALPMARLSA